MGINGLLGEMPGGGMNEQLTSFTKLAKLLKTKYGNRKADIDTGTLVYSMALMKKHAFDAGDYLPAVSGVHRQLLILDRVYGLNFTAIFDGQSPEEKSSEHQRRRDRNNDNSVVINSTYIAMCAEVCEKYFFDYIIAPEEADMQVGRRNKTAIAICRDSDLIAYGHQVVVIVDSYIKEQFRVIDMNTPITPQTKDDLPLYYYYKKYGIKVIHWWAAVMGCDITKEESGVKGIGRATFYAAMGSFENKPILSLNTASFTKSLKAHARFTARLPIIGISDEHLQDELSRVSDWFIKRGTYYDSNGNVCSLEGEILEDANNTSIQHMRGKLDSKTRDPFCQEQQKKIESVQTHNLAHNSAANREKINGLSFPEGKTSVGELSVDQLRTMITARGGNVSASCGKNLNKAELQRILTAYLLAEVENPVHTVYFDRSRKSNGTFAKIDTNEKNSAAEMIKNLERCNEHEESIQQFFRDLLHYIENNKFLDDFLSISMLAPDLQDEFIVEAFIGVGDSRTQKNIRDGLTRVLEMRDTIYHAMAFAEDGKSMYIISKQHASQKHDEKTRSKTDNGERPLRKEYLVLLHIAIEPTTQRSHGHTLGRCTRILRSYCVLCKAGCGMCHHRSGGLWMQLLHWGEGRPTPKPSTADFCPWIPGSNCKRECSTLLPAARNSIMQLPKTSEEAKHKLECGNTRSSHVGEVARYDWHNSDQEIIDVVNSQEYRCAEKMKPLFKALQEAQEDGNGDSDDD